MNFDIKKDSIIQLIKKTIEANITCCEYLMKNYKIDDIIVKRKNKIIELKKVSSDIFIEDYGQDVGPIKIQFLPNNSLTLKINNNITLTVQQFITDFKKEQEFKKFDVKFFGISVSKKYEIITNYPQILYNIVINNNNEYHYTITKEEYYDIIKYYKHHNEIFNNEKKHNDSIQLTNKIKTDLINLLELNKIEIKLI